MGDGCFNNIVDKKHFSTINPFRSSFMSYEPKNILLTVPRRYFFCGSFMFLFCLVFAMFCARLFICALWSPAGKGLTS